VARRGQTSILATLLFTDVVGSTRVAEEMGDRRWRELLARHHRLIRTELKRFGGRELDTAGDGFFATFHTPASAIRCACAVSDAVRTLGIEVRTGVHIGECEVLDGKVSGVNVHVAVRTMALAEAGDVLVTGSLKDLVRGAEFGYADRGVHQLKGVDGDWHLFEVTSIEGAPRPPVLSGEESRARRDAIRPPPLRKRRGVRLAVGAGALAVVVGVAAAALTSGSPPAKPQARRAPPDAIRRIDVTRDIVTATIAIGRPSIRSIPAFPQSRSVTAPPYGLWP
jgi:class 3 adenylate cyclase